jgi:hypothetical protein
VLRSRHFIGGDAHAPTQSVSNANPTSVFRALVQCDRRRLVRLDRLNLVHLAGSGGSVVSTVPKRKQPAKRHFRKAAPRVRGALWDAAS